MDPWYTKKPAPRSDEETRQAQQAYYKTFLASKDGREVVCDMIRRIAEQVTLSGSQENCAVAQIWLEGFMKDTLTMCGMSDQMEIIKARYRVCRSYIHKKPEPFIPEDHSE